MNPLEVAPLVAEYNVGPLELERRDPPVANQFHGYTANTPQLVELNPVAAHNLEGRDLLQVREADRTTEMVEFYTYRRLFVADGGRVADVVTYRGRRFRIVQVQDYEEQGAVYISIGALEEVQAVP